MKEEKKETNKNDIKKRFQDTINKKAIEKLSTKQLKEISKILDKINY